MADKVDQATRSRIMAQVHSTDSKEEIAARKALHAAGLRFRLHRPDLPGKPDIVLPRHKMAIFIHGCFWHSHEGCRRSRMPTTNVEYWQRKIDRNKRRDAANIEALAATGWRVRVIWGCEVQSGTDSVLKELGK